VRLKKSFSRSPLEPRDISLDEAAIASDDAAIGSDEAALAHDEAPIACSGGAFGRASVRFFDSLVMSGMAGEISLRSA
jgi:hypothetical protein